VIRRSYLARRLREVGVVLDGAALSRLFELVRRFDEILRVEFDAENLTVAVRLYDRSRERIIARNRVARFTIPLLEDNTMEKLSGQGDLGTSCPKCQEPLEFEEQEYDSGDIYDRVICVGCFARFSIHYKAYRWAEL